MSSSKGRVTEQNFNFVSSVLHDTSFQPQGSSNHQGSTRSVSVTKKYLLLSKLQLIIAINRIPTFIQFLERDLRYLVENIWNSQSVLSAHEDLFDQILVRWNKYEEWSPWNCILLTKEEASAHAKLENVTEAYGRMFIGKILHKHVLARNYFSRLPGMAEHMKKKISGQTRGLAANNGARTAALKA